MENLFENPFFLAGAATFGLIIYYLAEQGGGTQKKRLTTAAYASKKAILASTRQGIKQLKKPSRKRVCLWLGDYNPEDAKKKWVSIRQLLQYRFQDNPSPLIVPSCNPLIEVMGKSGSGKTYSVINPLLMSAIEQGHPILLYEAKADGRGRDGQMSFIMAYAKKHGYDVQVFAPGRDYSCTINPLDFMKDYKDATMAKVIGDILHANLRGKDSKKDGFFGPAGARLVRACLQFAKAQQGQQVDDFAMAFKILSLSDLPKRLIEAKEQGNFPFWSQVPFEQLMSVANAAPTSGGILGGAMDLLESLLEPNLMPSYVGKTNTNIKLGRKQLLVMQTDTQRMEVVNPLLATLMTLIINYNFSEEREPDCPLIVCCDEFPTLVLEQLPDWANRLRSKGLVLILGYQEYNQLEKNYSKQDVQIIRGPANHRFLLNPGTFSTAEDISKSLGQTETVVKNISRSRGQGGGSRSVSEQIQQTPLISADEIINMTQGTCLYMGTEMVEKVRDPRSRKQKRMLRPLYPHPLCLRQNYAQIEERYETVFRQKIFPWLVKRALINAHPLNPEQMIKYRSQLAETLLPLPTETNLASDTSKVGFFS
ncbi:MAG: type IV secretory system conjugative DNA transfer family protein [Microcystaceae cyanobacterium]